MDFHIEMMNAHKELHNSLEQLEKAALDHGDPSSIRMVLQEVRQIINEHFQFEEKGGYMVAVLTLKPYLHRAVAELLSQHRQLAQELDCLIEMLEVEPLSKTRESIQAWLENIRRHEIRENLFVQETLDQDEGAKD